MYDIKVASGILLDGVTRSGYLVHLAQRKLSHTQPSQVAIKKGASALFFTSAHTRRVPVEH